MGFSGTLLYVRASYMDNLILQPAVQQQVDSGYLQVVRFDYLPDIMAHSGEYEQVRCSCCI